MRSLELKSYSPQQTQLLGNRLGELAQQSDIVLLTGELGAGKTCLVQGIAHGLGVEEYAFSPSFVIVREYHGRLPLYHIDLYRLDDTSEIADLGLEEYLCRDGISVIEWAEKALELLPQDKLLIRLSYVPGYETQRTISLRSEGQRYSELAKQLKSVLNRGESWS